jgi:anti-sigma28 factor (negative regulator of flagellin synthesis)
MRIIGTSSDLGSQGIQKEALEGFWNKWNKPSKPGSPASPSTPTDPQPAVQDAYSQMAMQYGADFQERLEAITPWAIQATELIQALANYMKTGMKMEFPPGNPLVNADGMEYLTNLNNDVQTWASFAQRELKRLEQTKRPPEPFPWDDEAVEKMIQLKDVGKKSFAQISGELFKLKGVPVTDEQVKAKYQEERAKTGSTPATAESNTSGTTSQGHVVSPQGMNDLGASIPESIGMRRTADHHEPKSDSFEDQLKAGIEIEKEHAPTVEKIVKDIQDGTLDMDTDKIAELIARDHIKELPDYYSRLIEMEEKAK